MNRTDTPLDGMLRHLGAAYYDSLHGRTAPTEVVRALDCVAEHIHEPPVGLLAATRTAAGHPRNCPAEHHDLWHSRRLMSARRVRRLPVVDASGRLAGTVSLRDLLSLFVRSDDEIAWQVTEMLAQILPADPAAIHVTVHDGIVTLTTAPGLADHPGLLALAAHLTWGIDGVVDVVSAGSPPFARNRGWPAPGPRLGPLAASPPRAAASSGW